MHGQNRTSKSWSLFLLCKFVFHSLPSLRITSVALRLTPSIGQALVETLVRSLSPAAFWHNVLCIADWARDTAICEHTSFANQMQAPLNPFLSAAPVLPPSWAAGPLFWPRRWPWSVWGWPWPWASSPWCPFSSSTSGGPSSSSTAPTPSSSSSPRRSWCLSASRRSGTPSKTAPEVSVRSLIFPPNLAPTLSSNCTESTGWFLSRP
jgi:hypothetical protein